MKRTLATLCLTLALLFGSAGEGWSADFHKGLAAARSGDFPTALREWKPLGEQGDANAQYNLGQMYCNGEGYETGGHVYFWVLKSSRSEFLTAQTKGDCESGQTKLLRQTRYRNPFARGKGRAASIPYQIAK